MAQTVKASVVLASAWGASALVASGSRGFLANSDGMRPDVVAATLAKVEDQWAAQAAAFVDCSTGDEADMNCDIPGKAFQKSCGTIVSAAVQASDGDRDRVAEYMNDICKEKALDARHRSRCQSLMTTMVQHMGGDAYSNRETFDSVPLCARFWEKVKSEEKTAIDQKRAERVKAEAEQKKAEEEEAKRMQAEEDSAIAFAAKKAEEAAKVEQEAAAVAKVADESAKKQIQDIAVASIAKGKKTEVKAEPEVEDKIKENKVAADDTQPKVSGADAKVVVADPKVPAPKAEPKVERSDAKVASDVAQPKVSGSVANVVVDNHKAPAPKAKVETKVGTDTQPSGEKSSGGKVVRAGVEESKK